MKLSELIKTLVLMAGILLFDTHVCEAKLVKPSGGSVSANVVISKVFYSGSKTIADSPKAYANNIYIELYNNSTDTLDLKGMYIALGNTDNGDAAWTASAMATAHKDSAVVKQLFQISPDASYPMKPGQSVVLAQCAINHSQLAGGNVDLSSADFEVKSQNKNYKDSHNENVPEMKVIATFGTTDFINFMAMGPNSIMLLAADLNLEKCPKTFPKGKEKGNEYLIVPLFKSIDCVDIVKQKAPSADDKRFAASYDAGFTHTNSPDNNNAQAVVRKTAFVCSDGRVVLFDTNNSSVDFESTDDLSLRTYNNMVRGLSDSTIVIPETGYATVNITRPFSAGRDVTFVCVNATNNAATTDLTYNEYPGDSILLIKGPWIAVGKPGVHTIQLSESQGVQKTRSSFITWAEEDTKTLSGSQASRSIYKFSNVVGKIGFQRVPAVDGKYNTATFSDGDRLYFSLTTAIADKIAAANGATDHADLDFIAWHGITPEKIAAGISEMKCDNKFQPVVHNLAGQRLSGLQKGLNIVDGKKILVK